jgi:hypothetical protein
MVGHSVQRTTRTRWLMLTGVLTVGASVAAPVIAVSAADPPGNNGTIKIDDLPFDDHPDNEPHVGCGFEVDFYGYDEGDDLFADVIFEVWPPTGGMFTILEDTVFIGEDDNSGGGSEAGLDASEFYDLTAALAGFDPHPQQGWHVKLTIHADGSQGADVKHKVFWVTECAPPPTTTTTTTTTSTTTTTTTTTPPTTSTSVSSTSTSSSVHESSTSSSSSVPESSTSSSSSVPESSTSVSTP